MIIKLNKIYDLWYFNVKPKDCKGFDVWLKSIGGIRLTAGGSPYVCVADEDYVILKLKDI